MLDTIIDSSWDINGLDTTIKLQPTQNKYKNNCCGCYSDPGTLMDGMLILAIKLQHTHNIHCVQFP